MTVTSIEGKKRTDTKCMFCGIVSEKKHPEYSCPRIKTAMQDSDGGYQVEFWSPAEWSVIRAAIERGEM